GGATRKNLFVNLGRQFVRAADEECDGIEADVLECLAGGGLETDAKGGFALKLGRQIQFHGVARKIANLRHAQRQQPDVVCSLERACSAVAFAERAAQKSSTRHFETGGERAFLFVRI